METKVDSLQTGQELVDLARTAAKLRRAAKSLEHQSSDEIAQALEYSYWLEQ